MTLTPKGVRVMISMPTHRDLPPMTVVSLMETGNALIRQKVPYTLEMQIGNSLVHLARTKSAHNFLKDDWTHFFCVDSDITWNSDDFLRLCMLATHPKMDVCAVTYPYKKDPLTFHMNVEDRDDVITSNEYGLIPAKSAGLGFTIVKRKVIEALAEKAQRINFKLDGYEDVASIFRSDIFEGGPRGEDIAFFDDIRELGFNVWVDPTITLGHIGSKEYKGALADHLEKQEKAAKAA